MFRGRIQTNLGYAEFKVLLYSQAEKSSKKTDVQTCAQERPQVAITNFRFLIEPFRNKGDITAKEKQSHWKAQN